MKLRFLLLCLFVLCLLADIATLLNMLGCLVAGSDRRFERLAIAKDRCANGMLNGDILECISSRSGRKWPRMERFVNWLFGDDMHCRNSIAYDRSSWEAALNGGSAEQTDTIAASADRE